MICLYYVDILIQSVMSYDKGDDTKGWRRMRAQGPWGKNIFFESNRPFRAQMIYFLCESTGRTLKPHHGSVLYYFNETFNNVSALYKHTGPSVGDHKTKTSFFCLFLYTKQRQTARTTAFVYKISTSTTHFDMLFLY